MGNLYRILVLMCGLLTVTGCQVSRGDQDQLSEHTIIIADNTESSDHVILPQENVVEEFEEVDYTLYARDYGAVGDGIHDDTKNIQRAIDDASELNQTLVIDEGTYLVSGNLFIRSNTVIIGYDATIYRTSASKTTSIFKIQESDDVSNVQIFGLTIRSDHDQVGTGFLDGSLTSNVEGFAIYSVDSLYLQDITFDGLTIAMNFGKSKNGSYNKDITMDHVTVNNATNPLLITSTKDMTIMNSTFSGSQGESNKLHGIYIDGDNELLKFINVTFSDTLGAGVHIFNGYEEKSNPKDMEFVNCHVINANVGYSISSDANNVKVLGGSVTDTKYAFLVNNSSLLRINNVNIEGFDAIDENNGVFYFSDVEDVIIQDVEVDARDVIDNIVRLGDSIKGIEFNNVDFLNINNATLLYAPTSELTDLSIRKSTIQFQSVNQATLRFTRNGQNIVLEENKFINDGDSFGYVAYNAEKAQVKLFNNRFYGFEVFHHEDDKSIRYGNILINDRHQLD